MKGGNGPIKWAKHALSVVSSPVVSDTEDTAGDQASIKTVESPAGIEVTSDSEEPVDLEEELGMSSPESICFPDCLTHLISQCLPRKPGGPPYIHSSNPK